MWRQQFQFIIEMLLQQYGWLLSDDDISRQSANASVLHAEIGNVIPYLTFSIFPASLEPC
jgi:hypothetical protein